MDLNQILEALHALDDATFNSAIEAALNDRADNDGRAGIDQWVVADTGWTRYDADDMPNQPDPARKGFQDLHTLVQAARNLKSEEGENTEYDRALVELIADTTGHGSDEGRAAVHHLVFDPPREF